MNGTNHSSYFNGASNPPQSYGRYQQPSRDIESSQKGHRHTERGQYRQQNPRNFAYYDEGTRQYVTEQAYFDRQEIIEDRRGQYSPARYYDDGQRLSDEQFAYQVDPYAPPKPPRGHQSKNKIYLPEENDDRLVRRNNQRNRYSNYSEKPPRSPHDSHSKRPSQHPRSAVRDIPHPGYDPQPEWHSQRQSRPSRRHRSEIPSQYQSFGSEPQSQVSRLKKHVDENYNYGSGRGRPDMYYPETASLDRREVKKQPQTRQRQDSSRVIHSSQRISSNPPSGYHSDRAIDERGYNPQIPDWLKTSDPRKSAVPQVGYQPVSMAPKQIYRSDGELDLSEYSDSEYRVRPTEMSRRNAPLAHEAPDRHTVWKTPQSSAGYRQPSEPTATDSTHDYGSWDRFSSSQDYYRYTTDEEMFSEPERDPPPVPVSAHYTTQPQHDIRRGYVQVSRSTYEESSQSHQEQQPLYERDTGVLYNNRDTQLTLRPSDPKRQPMIEMEAEESDEPPPLRTPREIKAYDQHVKKFRNSFGPVTRATVTATYQPIPTSPTSPTSPRGTHGIPPASTRYARPTSTPDDQLSQRQRSKSQERPFPAREFERSQSPLSEPETSTTTLRKIRSRNNSAVFCIVSQTSPLASSDQGSDAEVASGKVAPRDLPEREYAHKASQGECGKEPVKQGQQRRDLYPSSVSDIPKSEVISREAQNETFSTPFTSSDNPSKLGEVVEEPLVLPSATRRGNVYAIRDATEKKPENKPRNIYAEELAHQKKWNKYLNQVSEPEEVMEEPVVLPSTTQGKVYAIRQKPKDMRPSGKQQSFYEKELEAQAEQSRNAPEIVEGDRVVSEPLLLPSQTGDYYAVQTRPGRIRPAYEDASLPDSQRNGYPKAREPKDVLIRVPREPVEANLPVTSSVVPSVANMPSNNGTFVDDPDSGGYQYKPFKKRSRSLDRREPSYRPDDSGDRVTPNKENPPPELSRSARSQSLPRSGEERVDDSKSSNGNSPEAKSPVSMSKGEQLFVQKRKEAEFEDMRQKIVAAEKLRRLKILDAKAESEPDIATSRRIFFGNTSSTKSTPPSIELRMYSAKSKTVDYPSHKKVFQKADQSPQQKPVKADNQKEGRVYRDPEPEPLILQGVSEDAVNVSHEDSLQYAPLLKEHGQDEQVLEAWQIAELKRALKEYEEDVHSPRGRKKNRRERSKSDLTNMLLNALSQLEKKEAEKQAKDVPDTSSSASVVKPVAVDKDRPKVSSKTQPLSNLYRPPKSNDNLGYSSDSSQDPVSQQMSRAERLTGIPGVQIPALENKPKTPLVEEPTFKQKVKPFEETVVKPREEVSVQRAPLVTEETFPDEDIPLIDDNSEEADSGTEEETPPKKDENLLSPPKVGRKGSVDSVSTVDSASLARPFEDISGEYATMMSDHDVKKETPGGRSKSSSVDSLIQIASWDKDGEEKLGKDSPADEAYYSSSTKDGRRKRVESFTSSTFIFMGSSSSG
ncbi:hypothetical protein HOLleu_41441 [Holothuria leucospilota]|uniref:Uncharacterized protein n=1 Tax=Holothuria leucospilota TaxID=206669 RepID=A0A9Q0YFX4_HOLLE|nr:hypothetical protein HOLleu_41441 [Holothuria leucospilota]